MDLSKKPFDLSGQEIGWAEATLNSLTREEKVGQLFCLMGGDYSKDERQRLVSDYAVGGLLFRPMPREALRAELELLERLARVPLLKAANMEEGGSGAVSDGTFFGWPMAVAASGNLETCERLALTCASEGRQAGINWSFAPVCDLDINPLNPITNLRTFGSDPQEVSHFTRTFASTLQNAGMAACAKHFPGDGVDFRDQHLHPTYNSLAAEEWDKSYGDVYQALIADGLMSVMAGHIAQPALCMRENPALAFADCLPASQSRELLEGVLRGRLGFNGLIATDATIMGGFCQSMPRREAIPASIAAGCDMLVFSTDFYRDYHYMLSALEDGRLAEERLNAAVMRILALKAWCRRASALPVPKTNAALWIKDCANESITLVKNLENSLPITKERFPIIRLVPLGSAEGIALRMRERLISEGFYVTCFCEEREELRAPNEADHDCLTLILANYETASNQVSVRISWCKKHALDMPRFICEEPAVFLSFANPYHLMDVPRIKTYINAYGCTDVVIDALIDKLLGKSRFLGKSPIDAFCGMRDTYL